MDCLINSRVRTLWLQRFHVKKYIRNYIVKDITIIIIEDVPKKLLYNKNFHAFVFSEAESTLHNLGDIFPTFD